MVNDKEFIKWLETKDFFTDFVSSNPDKICWIIASERGDDFDVRVCYNPKYPRLMSSKEEDEYSWLSGYGDHGVSACELEGLSPYGKFIDGEWIEPVSRKWSEVYSDWKRDIRDTKISNLIN